MKKNQFKEIKSKTIKELLKSVNQLKTEITKLTVEVAAGKVKNVAQIREKRKDIARILTIISEKELENI